MNDDAQKPEATASEVAEYMVSLIPAGHGRLAQSRASALIRKNFGLDYVVKNKNGNWGIRPDILKAFNSQTSTEPHDLVWMKAEQTWRRRRPEDEAGRLAKRKKRKP